MTLFEDAAKHIRKSDFIVDVGPGLRPEPFFVARRHICIEPHHEYAAVLKQKHYEVMQETAQAALPKIEPVDTIFMLDVIEHMEKEDGLEVLNLAKSKANQVVVFTPLGFLKQSYKDGEKDAWGMNGTYWQTHRSGWTPDEFEGWKILEGIVGGPMFFAIWK